MTFDPEKYKIPPQRILSFESYDLATVMVLLSSGWMHFSVSVSWYGCVVLVQRISFIDKLWTNKVVCLCLMFYWSPIFSSKLDSPTRHTYV